ncbi:MAG: hypothetical protein ACYCY5_12740, partial [Sulfuricella sp.]
MKAEFGAKIGDQVAFLELFVVAAATQRLVVVGIVRESVNTEIPVTISSSCTNGDAAYEDEHLGTQR